MRARPTVEGPASEGWEARPGAYQKDESRRLPRGERRPKAMAEEMPERVGMREVPVMVTLSLDAFVRKWAAPAGSTAMRVKD